MAEAAAQGDLATVRAFLSHGVQVNAQEPSDGKTALAAAATGCQPAVARYLVEQGADVNLVNASGDSPLAEATAAYCHDVIALLRSRGAALIRGTAAQHDAQVDRELRVSDTDRGRRTDPDSVGIAPR